MKNLLWASTIALVTLVSCNQNSTIDTQQTENKANMENPLLVEWNTPFNTPPFNKIKPEHYIPAFKEAIKHEEEAVQSIINNKEEANFDNTIYALEDAGMLLDRVSSIFFNITGTDGNAETDSIEEIVTPLVTKASDEISMNAELFARIKLVYDNQDNMNLNEEQKMVLKRHYESFVRNGALLQGEAQERLKDVNGQLADLAIKFKKNVLAETNAFNLIIDNKEDLSGLPQSAIDAAAITAKENGQEGKWIFTLDYPSIWPFMQNSNKRELRKKMHNAYINRGNNNNANDNKKIVVEIANLRLEKANLLGFKSYADYVLDANMAKTAKRVNDLLDKIMPPALAKAKEEAADLQKMIDKSGEDFKLEHWDWWYYTNKLKQEKYALDDEILRPYFRLENVRNGAFEVAHKLYGLTFTEITNVDKYNPENIVFEVKNAEGETQAILYQDFFPRASKRAGAWMTTFRKEYKLDGKRQIPLISMVCNFSKPTQDKPSLLTLEEVETLFHEFGHSIHGMLANTTYYSLSGTSTPRDFVEMPSQFMENFVAQPEVLKSFAKHYKTGKVISDDLVEKMDKSGKFNQGFVTTEYMAAAILDMDWHSITSPIEIGTTEFENAAIKKMGLIPEIIVRYRSTYFSHIWSGGYATGYYGYIWAAILDSDCFASFKEHGLFDKATADAFKDKILSRGGTREAMDMFVDFKGAEPNIDPLLEKRGLK